MLAIDSEAIPGCRLMPGSAMVCNLAIRQWLMTIFLMVGILLPIGIMIKIITMFMIRVMNILGKNLGIHFPLVTAVVAI